jgi:hypothetical protein
MTAPTEWSKPRKKAKASKLDGELITLTEGDLGDIGDTVREVTREAIDEAMTEQQIVLGVLRVQLQELGARASQPGTIATHGATGMSATEQLLQAKMANTIALPAGALITENAEDRAVVGRLTGLGLNLAALPRESLYQLQDSATMELRAREGRAVQVLSEQELI